MAEASLKYLTHIDLNGNELRNVRLQNLTTAPEVGATDAGRIYFNTTDHVGYLYNGTTWVAIKTGEGADGNTTYTFTTNNQGKLIITSSEGGDPLELQIVPEAIATLETTDTIDKASADDDAKIPTVSAVENFVSTEFTNYDTTIKQYIDGKVVITEAMRYMGTVDGSNPLPTDVTNVRVGDTYKVAEDGTYEGQVAIVGDMFIAKAVSATITWDYIPSGNDQTSLTYSSTNPELTPTGGICTWTVPTANKAAGIEVRDVASGEVVIPQIVYKTNSFEIKIVSANTITAGTYEVIYVM
jgi:hypothetical protein